MEYSDFEKLIYHVMRTEEGQLLLSQLEEKYVYTSIVQLDGEVASALRAGKSDLVRYFRNVYQKIKDDE